LVNGGKHKLPSEHPDPQTIQAHALPIVTDFEGQKVGEGDGHGVVADKGIVGGCLDLAKATYDALLCGLALVEELPYSNDDKRCLRLK
jgi:hypothetical protein